MKQLIIILAICIIAFFSGCVCHDADTIENLQRTSDVVSELDDRCQEGDTEACEKGLSLADDILKDISDNYDDKEVE